MKLLSLALLLAAFNVNAQDIPDRPGDFSVNGVRGEIPYFELLWTEGDGTVQLPSDTLEYFGQMGGRIEIDWIPTMLHTTGAAQRILDIPGHLGVWVWNDGIHGQWYNELDESRLFRTRWGLPAVGVESRITVTWDFKGYATIVDNVLRIHDWQTKPTQVYPDPGAMNGGVYGSRVDGTNPTSGAFKLRVYDKPRNYARCLVDTVGTINENVLLDNSGAWSQGIDPLCFTKSVTLSWTNAVENEDGTPLAVADIDKIIIYLEGTLRTVKVPPEPTTAVFGGLSTGTHCFYASTLATNGEESTRSNITCKDVP